MQLKEIEDQIAQLSPEDLAKLAAWFEQFHNDAWDAKIEQDSRAGRLNALIRQEDEEFDASRFKPL